MEDNNEAVCKTCKIKKSKDCFKNGWRANRKNFICFDCEKIREEKIANNIWFNEELNRIHPPNSGRLFIAPKWSEDTPGFRNQ